MVRLAFVATLAAFWPGSAESQAGAIRGTVTDSSTGQLVDIGEVTLASTAVRVPIRSGRFIIPFVRAGTYQATITGIGYRPAHLEITVTPDSISRVAVLLAPGPLPPAPTDTLRLDQCYRVRAGAWTILLDDPVPHGLRTPERVLLTSQLISHSYWSTHPPVFTIHAVPELGPIAHQEWFVEAVGDTAEIQWGIENHWLTFRVAPAPWDREVPMHGKVTAYADYGRLATAEVTLSPGRGC